jgi:hypothetical protein
MADIRKGLKYLCATIATKNLIDGHIDIHSHFDHYDQSMVYCGYQETSSVYDGNLVWEVRCVARGYLVAVDFQSYVLLYPYLEGGHG